MVTIKEENKDNKRNFKSTLLIIGAILLAVILIIGLTFVLVLTNKTKTKFERAVAPSDISEPIEVDENGNLTLTYSDAESGVKETFVFSSNASIKTIDNFDNISYLYHMKDSNPFNFKLEYTVSGVKYKDMSVQLYQSDKAGVDIVEIPSESYKVSTIDNGVSLSYGCERTDLYIYKVKVSYFVY